MSRSAYHGQYLTVETKLIFQFMTRFKASIQPLVVLEDFMTVTPTAVYSASNLTICVVSVSANLIADSGVRFRGRDLKVVVRGRKYVA